MNPIFRNAVDKYLRFLKESDWIRDESYKFEFANYVYHNVNWDSQNDEEILEILINSQKINYTDSKGIQFIQVSGTKTKSEFIAIKDVKLLRKVKLASISDIDWSNKTMSYTGLSAWIASLYPDKFYPIPMKGFDETIKYLFGNYDKRFPKIGKEYILQMQDFLHQTWEILSSYPVEHLCLIEWNKFYKSRPDLRIPEKTQLEKIDKIWLAQDFHVFVHNKILNLVPNSRNHKIQEIPELFTIEGKSILSEHLRYERNSSFIKKIKKIALNNNRFLRCEVCKFSFFETYGEIGVGFIEAHHLKALSQSASDIKTTKNDIALVCSNCHRMLHRDNMSMTIDELRKKIKF